MHGLGFGNQRKTDGSTRQNRRVLPKQSISSNSAGNGFAVLGREYERSPSYAATAQAHLPRRAESPSTMLGNEVAASVSAAFRSPRGTLAPGASELPKDRLPPRYLS
jgi:hypothetical protein